MEYAETYIRYAAPVCVPACPVRTADRLRTGKQVIPQIDAGIAEKGHFWLVRIRHACRNRRPGVGERTGKDEN